MKKTVFDISPPGKNIKEEMGIEKDFRGSTQKRGWLWFLIIFLFVLVLAAVVYFTSPLYARLTLELYPKTETENFGTEVEINQSQLVINLEDKIIPGKFLTGEGEETLVFETQGKAHEEGKAEGMIRVYNSHQPPRAVTLRATTRFLSGGEGKIFRSPQEIYLAPAQIKDGKLIPSIKEVKVVAQEPGEDYNIKPSKFSVPGLAGTELYYTIWAESTEAMSGGFRREVTMVTEEDLKRAENSLKESLLKSVKDSLSKELPVDYLLPTNSSLIDGFQFSCLEQQGEKAEQFSCEAKLKIKTLAFKISELKEIALQELKGRISPQKTFDSQSLAMEFSPKNLLSETGKLVLEVEFRINLYDKISEDGLFSRIKKEEEARARDIIFSQYPEIKKLKFNFWPFWVKRVPATKDKVEILIKPSL